MRAVKIFSRTEKHSLAFCYLQFAIRPLDLSFPAKNAPCECVVFHIGLHLGIDGRIHLSKPSEDVITKIF